jgi:hypothetical protein
VELANGLTKTEAGAILFQNKVHVISDLLFNGWWRHRLLLRIGAEHHALLLVLSKKSARSWMRG